MLVLALGLKAALTAVSADNWIVGLASAAFVGFAIGCFIAETVFRNRAVSDNGATTRLDDWSDIPLSDPADDNLGHARFARTLAESLGALERINGFVVGLDGEWGSGKSTILNFMERALRELPGRSADVVRVNPWLFAGEEGMVRRFLLELEATLRGRSLLNSDARRSLRELAKLLGRTPVPGSGFLEEVLSLLFGEPDIRDVKRRVEVALRVRPRNLIVIVDDLDRLSGVEIRDVFQAVKALADFPNVIYVVAFDRSYVLRALGDTPGFEKSDVNGGSKADEYLEKIVQAPFTVPRPAGEDLHRLLTARLDMILKEIGETEHIFDEDHWAAVYQGLRALMRTPRQIMRLVNMLRLTYSAEEVRINADFADVVGVEALRIFAPDVYGFVVRNPPLFLFADDDNVPQLQAFIETIETSRKDAIKQLLISLFPITTRAWDIPIRWGENSFKEWYRRGRVANRDVFPLFFRLALSPDAIAPNEMRSLLSTTDSVQNFEPPLLGLKQQLAADGTSRLSRFLELLQNYTDSISLEEAEIIIESFFDVGDELIVITDRRARPEFFGIEEGNDLRIGRVVYQLLRRFDATRAFELLRRAVANGIAISTIVKEVRSLMPTEGVQRQRDAILPPNKVNELKDIALDKIRSVAKRGELMNLPDLPNLLYRWLEWAPDEVEPWARQATSEDSALIRFLTLMISRSVVEEAGRATAQERWYFKIEEVARFINPQDAYQRVRHVDRESLSNEQRLAVEKFIEFYLKSGTDITRDE